MENKTKGVAKPASQALRCLPDFGPPPLLKGEDAATYDDLLARVSGNVKPSDIFEEIWVREIVNLLWETARWRRHLARFHTSAIPKTLARILKPITQDDSEAHNKSFLTRVRVAQDARDPGKKLANGWLTGDKTAIEVVQGKLVSTGLTMDDVVAQATASELDKIERFNRLITNATWRCNALLREIDRHRAAKNNYRHDAFRKIENAKYETVDANAVARNEIVS